MKDQRESRYLEQARALHARAVVLDTHCDTVHHLLDPAWNFATRHEVGHLDLPRLREGGISGVFFAAWTPPSAQPGEARAAAHAQLDALSAACARHADQVVPARTAAEVRAAHAQGKFTVILAIEGGHLIEDSLEILREYHQRGATYLTLTHSLHTEWADSSGVHQPLAPRHGGLTEFGCEVIAELNRLGMMVDVSHVSADTCWDVLEVTRAPVIASHSACHAVTPHRRNLSDSLIKAIAAGGGVVQINFCADFLDAAPAPTSQEERQRAWDDPRFALTLQAACTTPMSNLVDHVDHALQLVGPRYVGLGSDFDGVPTLPVGMEDCSKLPHLTAALLERGYSEADLAYVLGENVLRVMDACRAVAGA